MEVEPPSLSAPGGASAPYMRRPGVSDLVDVPAADGRTLRVLVPDWPAPPGVRACTTTRQGGLSEGSYHALNLAAHVGDDPRRVAANRRLLRSALDLPREPRWLTQVHGCRVVEAGDTGPPPDADASVARGPGPVCAVLTADCLPVLLCDRSGTRAAAAHAGWRGLSAGVLEATVAALGGSPEGLIAWMGPAIGPRAYEVGAEVRRAFLAADPAAEVAFVPSPGGRWLADVYALARQRLAGVGVHAVYGGGLCCYEDPTHYYSYRRDRVTGRMASLVWLTTDGPR